MNSFTLKAKDIKEMIASQLTDTFSKDGFTFNKSSNEWRRNRDDYASIFNIDHVAWSNSHSLHVRLYINQKKVESILEKIIGKQNFKITLGSDIDRIYSSPDGRKVVSGDLSIWLRQNEDVDAAVESLERYYTEIAKPYFEKYSTLEAIDDIMNNPPFDHSPAHVGGMFDNRCMKGLIVARLIGNPNFEQLVTTYDEAIKSTMNDESINNYYKVKEYLTYNRI